jgi:hypothetical protein
MTREEFETALDAGLLKYRQWPPVVEGRLWAVQRNSRTALSLRRSKEFRIAVKLGKFGNHRNNT